jgi:hypothetical protein
MLVTLLMWAYAQGVTSSRRIEAACWQDVAFRVICAGVALLTNTFRDPELMARQAHQLERWLDSLP